MSNEVLDPKILDQIRRLQKPGKPDLLKGLIVLFIESSQSYFDLLRSAKNKGDLATLAQAAHSLKSSSANLGALAFSKTCLELEKIGNKETHPLQMSELFIQAEKQYDETIRALKSLL